MSPLAETLIIPASSRPRLSGVYQAIRAAGQSEIFYLGVLVAILQILDGVLTAMGMMHFGTPVEGNPILRFMMDCIGIFPTLIAIKALAIGIIVTLCCLSKQVTWVGFSLRCVAVIYLWFAVIPWSVIIYTKVL